jgi:hypothetical protein
MPNEGRGTPDSRDQDSSREHGKEQRETGMEYGANEAEQTRERERAGHDKTDEIGEITETELP